MAYEKKYEKTAERDYQKELTEKFIARLKEAEENISKGLKWDKPFFECNEMPINGFTGERYKGTNTVALLVEEKTDPRWFTFNQLQEMNKSRDKDKQLFVNKGTKASHIMKVVQVYAKDNEGNILKDAEGKAIPVMNEDGHTPKIGFKWYPVFNGQDIKGLEPHIKPNLEVKPEEAVKMLAEALQAKDGLKVEHSNQTRAYYSPSEHKVHMPNPELFKSTQGYHDTLLHELGHSTGKTLGRDQTGTFGDKKYAYEELCAELSSSFMAVELGLKHDPSSHENHSAYLNSWIKALENDKFMLSKASNHASKATEFQMSKFNEFKQELEQKKEQEKTQEQAQDKAKEQTKSEEKKPRRNKELTREEAQERLNKAKEILKPKTKEKALSM